MISLLNTLGVVQSPCARPLFSSRIKTVIFSVMKIYEFGIQLTATSRFGELLDKLEIPADSLQNICAQLMQLGSGGVGGRPFEVRLANPTCLCARHRVRWGKEDSECDLTFTPLPQRLILSWAEWAGRRDLVEDDDGKTLLCGLTLRERHTVTGWGFKMCDAS
ncbi:hypothetical protein BaRGS_00004289 [Batillaria attramentaria]|uniref:Uncharacterized protein n=1 Tax=Batillaria attramentaria TaxID=370345 RepID=A0ABD0LZI4_9CAEN